MKKIEIARLLKEHREKNEYIGYRPGAGCPFVAKGERIGDIIYSQICEKTCAILFPKWRSWSEVKRQKHPCYGLSRRYVVTRCRKFAKKYLPKKEA